MGKQNEARRRLVRVKLGQKGIEDLVWREALVGARKIGAIAPILIGPEKKDLDAELSGLFDDGENIRLFDGLGVDALRALDGGERGDAVAQPCRAFELHRGRGRGHFLARAGRARRGSCRTKTPGPRPRVGHIQLSPISPVQGAEQRLI